MPKPCVPTFLVCLLMKTIAACAFLRHVHATLFHFLFYCIREFCAASPSVRQSCNERFSCRNETFPSRASQPMAMHTSCFGAPTPRSSALRLDSPRLCRKFHTFPAVAPISSGLHVSI